MLTDVVRLSRVDRARALGFTLAPIVLRMKKLFLFAALLASLVSTTTAAPKPLRVLLFAGGCCHDYAVQHLILKEGLEARAYVEVDAVHSFDRSTKATFAPYEKPDWAKDYDVIVHDECSADVKDVAYVNNILAAHRAGIPAVNLHCAMHSYRVGNISQPVVPGSPDALWFDLIGLQSTGHGPQEPIQLTLLAKDHPVLQGQSEWTTIKEELYNNIKIFPTATPLMRGRQVIKQKDGSEKSVESVVTWVNQYGKTRVFSSTIGHNNDTVADPRYLDLVTRGLLWSCDKLNDTYLKPVPATTGAQQVASAAAKAKLLTPPPAAPKPDAPAKPIVIAPVDGRPNLAVAGKASASSEESGKGNYAANAIDGDPDTRWCAAGGGTGHTWQVDLGKEQKITGVHISWESPKNTYRYRLEASLDGQQWQPLADAAKNDQPGATKNDFPATSARHVRVTFLSTSQGGWGSFWECAVLGEKGVPQPAPAAPAAGKKGKGKQAAKAEAKEPPVLPSVAEVEKMKPVTADKVEGILKDTKLPAGFEAKVFATPPAVNYPVFVAAAPDGTLYVSSDGNGSLGRLPNLGRILRVRDTNGDGEADEVKVFVPNVDSPRGLVWDHDRVICLHPPHISAFIDRTGEGHSTEEKVLIKGIAFGFKDRPADHTSNGLEIGVDGWIYAAIGDFGFMEAEGTDGRKLQLRGGGIVRFRPDGSGLQLYARGTRNILEAAVSPLLDLFTRDNTNDGGGWDVRFHHFSGFTDHGYPRLFKNFADELITPLADYGGGAGCGAAWIDEPGIPAEWNNAPFCSDWGRGWIYRHRPTPKGATFTVDQKEFIGVTRPTDLDVDAQSHIYAASWKGATFNWNGMDVGYIVRFAPKDFKPTPLPDFAKAGDAELAKLLESPSHRTRLEAQRTLIRRGLKADTTASITALAADKSKPLASRVAAVFALKQALGEKSHEALTKLTADATIAPWALRALTDREDQLGNVPVQPALTALASPDERTRKEGVVALARWHGLTGVWADNDTPKGEQLTHTDSLAAHTATLVPVLADRDAVIAHTAMQVLRQFRVLEPVFAAVDRTDSPTLREGALAVLRGIHDAKVVDGLLARLAKETDSTRRQGLLTALCRLHFKEGEWKGTSWGTRPDTRGPFFQPEEWTESKKIFTALNDVMTKADAKEAAYLAGEFNRHRLEGGASLDKLLALAQKDASVEPVLVQQLARAQTVPPGALAMLARNAAAPTAPAVVRAGAITALAKSDLNPENTRALLAGVAALRKDKVDDSVRDAATEAFLNSTFVEKQSATLLTEAAKTAGDASLWADAALLRIQDRLKDKQKAKAELSAAFDAGWAEPKRRAQLIEASISANKKTLAPKILASVGDADKAVATAAKKAIDRLKLETAAPTGPLVGSMKVDDVINSVMTLKGTVARGRDLYTQLGCFNCHTISPSEPPRGPILSQVATVYKRRELAESILLPSKSIAQGFAANRFILKDETEYEGFVVSEAADKIIARLVTAQEVVIKPSDIVKRVKLEKSLMPEGLAAGIGLTDLASLLDFLESLAHGEK
ncbi:MAG: heme-binding protein [Proteobacteria bacterium]|nr:heme-binding protein [Pseudomonadota bacterium]